MRTAFYADVKTNPAFQGQEILVGTNVGWSAPLRPGLTSVYARATAYPSAREAARQARRASVFGWVLPLVLLGGLGWLGYFGSVRAVQSVQTSWNGTHQADGVENRRVYQADDQEIPGPFSKVSAMWSDLRSSLRLGGKPEAPANP